MIDELDDLLTSALHERGRLVGAPAPRPGDVRRRVMVRRRRRIAVPVTAVLGLTAGVVASRALPAARTDRTTIDAPGAPSSTVDAGGTVATTAVGTTSTTTGAAVAAVAVPWLGVDDPNWLPRAALDVRSPGYLGGHRFLRFRADGDWRSTPAVDVIDRDRAPDDEMPNAEATTIDGRAAWIGRYVESTVVRIEIAPGRVAELHGRGVDEATLVAAAATTALEDGRLRMAAPAGLTLLSDAATEGLHTTHRLVYEASGDSNQRLWVTVTDYPAVAVAWTHTGRLDTLAGAPAIVDPTGSGWFAVGDTWSAIVQFVGSDPSSTSVPDVVRPLTDGEVEGLAVTAVEGSSMDQRYPVTPDAQRKGAAFTAAVPPAFTDVVQETGGDDMAVSWTARAGDRLVWLQLVRATDGAPVGAQDAPVVASDTGTTRVMRWRSPSGWIYELTADGLKARTGPPLTVDQMVALLQAVEAA